MHGTQVSYPLTAAAVWHARRTGQTLADILQTLETHSAAALPAKVRAEITRWSQQIDRLTLEVDEGRLLLRSHSPLAITAVRQHRTLKSLVAAHDATTVELQADDYPALVQTFDACSYPVMDRVPPGWKPGAVPVPPSIRSVRPTRLPARAAMSQEQRWSTPWDSYVGSLDSARRPPGSGGNAKIGSNLPRVTVGCMPIGRPGLRHSDVPRRRNSLPG